jgi:amino acid transporter
MSETLGSSGAGYTPPATGDAALDAGSTEDRAYLHALGYRQELRRALGLFSSWAIQWTLIAVAGGLALSLIAGLGQIGPAAFFAWLIAAGLQMVVALSVAEGVSAYPVAGGAYQIINRILGGRLALGWQVGWLLVGGHIAALATEAYGISPFIANWFGVDLTGHWPTFAWATVLIALSTIMNLVAVKLAAAFNNSIGVLAEVVAIAIVVGGLLIALLFGNSHFHSLSYLGHTSGVVPAGHSVFWPFLFAMLVPVFVISGFDANGTAGEETENAARTVPRAMLIASFGAFAIGTAIVLLTVLGISNLDAALSSGDPIRTILSPIVGSFLARTFEVMAVLSLFVNMMILQLTAARVMFAQARDGQTPFPRALTKLTRDAVPGVAVVVTAVLGLLLIVYTGLLTVLLSMTAILWAAGYTVLVGVLIYGKSRGMLPKRPFNNGRAGPLIDWVAFVWSLAICVILIKLNPHDIGLGFLGTIVLGLVFYYVMIPSSRRGILRDVRSEHEIIEHERAEAIADHAPGGAG